MSLTDDMSARMCEKHTSDVSYNMGEACFARCRMQSVVGVESAELAACRLQLGERPFLNRKIGMQIFVGSFDTLVAQP